MNKKFSLLLLSVLFLVLLLGCQKRQLELAEAPASSSDAPEYTTVIDVNDR